MKPQLSVDIIGLACRYPGGLSTPEAFWTALQSKATLIGEPPAARWRRPDVVAAGYVRGKSLTKRGGWLERVNDFDAGYFQISPNEAADLDPQQRLALEVAIEAIVDANLSPRRLAGRRVGVFVGAGMAEQLGRIFADTSSITPNSMTGGALSIIANRISYFLDLEGPSLTVDTACSSALTALYIAHRALEAGDCDMALVLGVNVLISDAPFVGFSQAHMLSPRGVSAPFDESADGFVRAEGCGACLLEPTGHATEPRRVYAQLIGSGTNEDGRTPSMTMPSPERQVELMSRVVRQAGVEPSRITFVEAHGTGTPVGDPIEAASLAGLFAQGRRDPLPIGSVKGHVGHLETASGLCGLTKAALCLHQRRLVPTAGHTQVSSKIRDANVNVRVITEVEELPPDGALFAGVSSYGFGGANAFALLRSAPPPSSQLSRSTPKSVVAAVSAHTPSALATLEAGLRAGGGVAVADRAAWNSVVHAGGRERVAFVGNAAEFPDSSTRFDGVAPPQAPRLLFAFGGQGSHLPRMASELYREVAAFRDIVTELDQRYAAASGTSLIQAYGFARSELAASALEDVSVTLPCIVVTQVALAMLLERAGVKPALVIGHSTGEMVAAWCAGALSLDDLCRLTHERATHQARMRRGAMAAFGVDPAQASQLVQSLGLDAQVTIAAVNARDAVTLAGDEAAIESCVQAGKDRGLRCTKLDVPRAYHSQHVQEILPSLREHLNGISPRDGAVPFISTVAGHCGLKAGRELDQDYWLANIERAVHFDQGCEAAHGLFDIALEVSARPVLATYLASCLPQAEFIPLLPRQLTEVEGLQQALARSFVAGVDVELAAVQPPGTFVAALPPPWDHDKPVVPNPNRERNLDTPRSIAASSCELSRAQHGFFADHQVAGQAVLPGAAYVTRALKSLSSSSLTDVKFDKFLPLWLEGDVTLMDLRLTSDTGEWRTGAGAHMRFRHGQGVTPPAQPHAKPRLNGESLLDTRRVYSALRACSGLGLSGVFESLANIHLDELRAVADVIVPAELDEVDAEAIAIDACFQLLGLLAGLDRDFWAPTAAERVARWAAIPRRGVWCSAELRSLTSRKVIGDLVLRDEHGTAVLGISGFVMTKVPSGTRARNLLTTTWQPTGVGALREALPQDPVEALKGLLTGAGGVLRVLDLTGSVLAAALAAVTPSCVLSGVVLGTDAVPASCARIAHLDEVSDDTFDVVVGSAAQRFLAPGGCLLDAAWQPGVLNGGERELPRVACLGEHYVPGFTTPSPLAQASLVVDSRDSLLAASELLRTMPPTASLLFISWLDAASPPSGIPGLARAILEEQRRDVRVVLVPRGTPLAVLQERLDPLLRDGFGSEYELELRDGAWWAPRLIACPTPVPPTVGDERRLEIGSPGQLSTLAWRPIDVANEGLGANEVRVQVHEAALHFKDIMLAMGLLPGFEPVLGLECSGTLLELGSAVAAAHPELAVGTTVLCCRLTEARARRQGLLGTSAVVEAAACFPLPAGLPRAEAAAFMGAFATAWYGLVHKARLEAGETVLVHSAAGGVGLAALEVARLRGARVLASVGSDEKRAWLRERYGLADFVDSHRPETFVEEVHALTQGRGVDVVLNSLAGQGLTESLRCLASGGRHVEIGKRDILEHAALDLHLLKENVSLLSVHLDLLANREPAKIRALLSECLELMGSGRVRLIPTTSFPASDVEAAFRYMSTGRHTGRIVLTLESARGIATEEAWPDALLAAHETQLVTGGTRGVGLALAEALAKHGAGRILLAGRQDLSPRAQLELESLRVAHPRTRFEPVRLDVTSRQALEELFSREPDLTGVFHLATDYKEQRADSIQESDLSTWQVKVGAAVELDRLTRRRAMRHFVLFGSLAGLHGNAGQAVYVAANAALGELVRNRRRDGLPGLAIDLPVMLGAGRLSDLRYVRELEFVRHRFDPISFHHIALDLVRRAVSPESLSNVVVHGTLAGDLRKITRYSAFIEHLAEHRTARREAEAPEPDSENVSQRLRAKTAALLGGKEEEIPLERPLSALGLDSLAAVELGSWVKKTFQVEVSQAELLTGLSLAALVARIGDAKGGGEDTRYRAARAGELTTSRTSTNPPVRHPAPAAIPAPAGVSTPRHEEGRVSTILPLGAVAPAFSDQHAVLRLPGTLDTAAVAQILAQVTQQRGVLVVRGASDTEFCLGMALQESFTEQAVGVGLEAYSRLIEALEHSRLPLVVVVEGACRGGGMLFPSFGTYVLAVTGASFGFPEVRRGGLPGLVSVAAQRRLSRAQCERYMLTGDAFDATRAKELGFADFVGTRDEVEGELSRVLARFATIEPSLMSMAKRSLPAASLPEALVTMGGLALSPSPFDATRAPIALRLDDSEPAVAILELDNPAAANAMDRELAEAMARAVAAIKARPELRALVLQGKGKHFCVGANSRTLMPQVRDLALPAAARLVFELYEAFVSLRTLTFPVVCAVQGHVVGGGLAAMLNADYRVCAADTTFNIGNLPRGVCPGLLLSQTLVATVGQAWANDLYLNDYTLDAQQALALGLVHEVASNAASAQTRALQMARELVAQPAVGVQSTLGLLRPAIDRQRLAAESLGIARCILAGDGLQHAIPAARRMSRSAQLRLPSTAGEESPGVAHGAEAKSPPAAPSPLVASRRASDVGIRLMEVYFPNHYASQEEMERFDGAPGKYTVGLGQSEVTSCGDDEDAISMALTVVSRLMERYGIQWTDIGRLEVGSESSPDRSKSIKSHLMELFEEHGCTDVEGIDSYHACYGGTAALFNSVAWCQSEAWDGRYAVVVCVDIAETSERYSFLQGGAAVAMLIGPDAALVLEPERGTSSAHTWDFYKPIGWPDPFPVMPDGAATIDVYMRCMDGAQTAWRKKQPGHSFLRGAERLVFHCTSVYLCRRAFQRLAQNDEPSLTLEQVQALFEEKTLSSTLLTRRIGTTYTASCYLGLYSLLYHEADKLIDSRIGVFSFGSGAIGSLFRFRVRKALPLLDDTSARLNARLRHAPAAFVRRTRAHARAYGAFPFIPSTRAGQLEDAYYLERVGEDGQRSYRRGPAAAAKLDSLPSLPLPALRDTLARARQLSRALLNSEEQARLGADCEALLNGVGPELQALLEERVAASTSYVFDAWLAKYLSCRASALYQGVALLLRERRLGVAQLEAAARLLFGVANAQLALRSGSFPASRAGARPLCTELLTNVLAATRVPGHDIDELVQHPAGEEVIVSHSGAFYPIRVIEGDRPRALAAIWSDLQNLEREPPNGGVGLLTTLERNRWASLRADLHRSATNTQSLNAIERALCLVSLDAARGDAPEDQLQALMFSSENRWFDKSLQLIVQSDGTLGLWMEHSGYDAGQLFEVLAEILRHAEQAHLSDADPARSSIPALGWELGSNVSAIEEARAGINEVQRAFRFRFLRFPELTRAKLLSRGVHPDVFSHLAFELTYLRLKGKPALAYQPVQTRHFRAGRTEALRPATVELLALASAFERGERHEVLRTHLERATQSLLEQQQRCLMGEGVDRHLFALRDAARHLGREVALFSSSELSQLVGPAPLCTSTSDAAPGIPDMLVAFFPETSDGCGIAYLISEQGFRLLFSASVVLATQFESTLQQVVNELASRLIERAQPNEVPSPALSTPAT